MDGGLVAALFTLAGAVVAAMFAYLGVRRQTSGRVETSDAASLWEESSGMREELRNEVASYRAQLHDTQMRLDTAIEKITRLLHDVAVSQAAAAAARAETLKTHTELARLQLTVNQVHQEVRTMNGLTLAELADNTETRRIEDKAPVDRTAAETQHVDTAGITDSDPARHE